MELKIKRVVDYGAHSTERVELEVTEDCNLKYYMLSDTTYTSENTVSNKLRHMHWFVTKDVKAGDEIVLYTKKGTANTRIINGGNNKKYIQYWGLDSYVWNNSGDAAILFKLKAWETTKVVSK